MIQAAFGPRREERLNSRTRLLLCGSAMSFMGRLLSGAAPLRGRAGLEMVVPTLDYQPGGPVLEDRRSAPGGLAVLDSRRHAGLPRRGRRRLGATVRGGLGPLGGGERPEQVQPALPRGPLPACRGTRHQGQRRLPLRSQRRRRGQRHPWRHRRLPGAQGHRHLTPPVGTRGRRPARPRRRRFPPRPEHLPNQRAADSLLPRDHAARVEPSGTAWPGCPGLAR